VAEGFVVSVSTLATMVGAVEQIAAGLRELAQGPVEAVENREEADQFTPVSTRCWRRAAETLPEVSVYFRDGVVIM
jgi:hypothetical protein